MKNYRFLSVFLMIVFIGFLTACHFHIMTGNGRIVSEERSVDRNFSAVALEGVGTVNIHPGVLYMGHSYRVIVTTDSNIQDIVRTDVSGSVLYIDEKSHSGFNPTRLIIDVYLPELKSVTLKGVGDIKVSSGNGSNMDVVLSGVGNIYAHNYEVQNADVRLSGTGDVKVWATNTLTGKLSGVGDILYKGSPVNTVNRTGVGKVKRL